MGRMNVNLRGALCVVKYGAVWGRGGLPRVQPRRREDDKDEMEGKDKGRGIREQIIGRNGVVKRAQGHEGAGTESTKEGRGGV